MFDCNVYLQFMLNPNGPAGRCVALASAGRVDLFVSDAVLAELRELPEKPVATEHCIDAAVVGQVIATLLRHATYVPDVPVEYTHPIDPDDSAYVNLALAAGASLIVSRDRHLLNLHDVSKPWGAEFRARFPSLQVLKVEDFLRLVAPPPAAGA